MQQTAEKSSRPSESYSRLKNASGSADHPVEGALAWACLHLDAVVDDVEGRRGVLGAHVFFHFAQGVVGTVVAVGALDRVAAPNVRRENVRRGHRVAALLLAHLCKRARSNIQTPQGTTTL
ncbi:MAG: hypothetical protein GY820_25155 [Gammaproteobacteria bacterium]|nr:hypothetical protein [Gammaproteobacteria bacterium]